MEPEHWRLEDTQKGDFEQQRSFELKHAVLPPLQHLAPQLALLPVPPQHIWPEEQT